MTPLRHLLRWSLTVASVALVSCSSSGSSPSGPDDPQPAAERVSVSSTSLAFVQGIEELSIQLRNLGENTVSWSVEVPTGWVTANPVAGELPPGTATLTVRVDRSTLSAGTHSGEIRIAIGEQSFTIAISVEKPGAGVAAITPTAFTFDEDDGAGLLVVSNTGTAPLSWSVSGPGWITLLPASGTLAAGAAITTLVQPKRSELPPGTTQGTIDFASNGGNFAIPVTVGNGAPPVLQVTPSIVNFGTSSTSESVTVSNTGGGNLTWSLQASAGWLTASPTSGTLGANASRTVTFTVSRDGLAPGPHQTTVQATSNGGSAAVVAALEVTDTTPPPPPPGPQLDVTPTAVDFGTSSNSETITVRNTGGQDLSWSLQSNAAWLTASSASGTLSPNASTSVALFASRSGLSDGAYQTTAQISSNGGSETVDASIEVQNGPPPPPPPSVALEGNVLDQFSGAGVAGLTVSFGGETATTDSSGHFVIAGTPTSTLQGLDISGSSIYTRETFARSSDTSWEVIPSSFNMTSFNDIAREYEPRTIRWVQDVSVYIDTTAHNFPGGGPVPSEWITEIENSVAGIVDDWSDGVIRASSVTTGTSPPSEGSNGWLVIQFDEDSGRYPSPSTVGLARTFWSGDRQITSGAIWLRFEGISSSSTRGSVFTHEVGHIFGMGHMTTNTQSIMSPSISTSSLSSFDRQAGEIVYSRSPGNEDPDRDNQNYFLGNLLVLSAAPVAALEWVCGDPAHATPDPHPIEP